MYSLKRVAYSYNSILDDGTNMPYHLDVLVQDGLNVLVDVHQGFVTKEEFDRRIEEIIPVLENKEGGKNENWQEQA